MSEPILIIGGGIGGMTAALALARQGVSVRVFEQASRIGDVGAGISIGPTASRGLYSLGLRDAIQARSDKPQASGMYHYQTGERLEGAFADRQFTADDLEYLNMIHRADLFDVLEAALREAAPGALELGRSMVDYVQDADGVSVRFADGGTARGRALIGADGVRSVVRNQMFGPEKPLFTGRVAYRFLVPIDLARPYMSAGNAASYVAEGRSLLRYAIRRGELVNCVAFILADDWEGEGWSQRVPTSELTALFDGWHADVIGLASVAPLEGTAKWALFDRDPIPNWVDGRVALLGDAAHPMLPFLGMGAASAIEDAVVLGRIFGMDSEPATALQRYNAARSPRGNLILEESRRQGQLFRNGPGEAKATTLTTHRERMSYDPATVAV